VRSQGGLVAGGAGLAEQRYKAELEVLNGGAALTDAVRRSGVVRQTGHSSLWRSAIEGLPHAELLFLPDLLPEVRAAFPEVEDSGGQWVNAEALRA